MRKPPRRKYSCENDFVDHVLRTCKKHGYTVDFRPVRHMRFKGIAGDTYGLFASDEKKLYVCTKNPSWFTYFIHEFGHLEQHLAGLWASPEDEQAFEDMNDWLCGVKEFSPQKVEAVCRVVQSCELDAEKRVARYVRRYKFPSIDLAEHYLDSNRYVLAYESARRTRTWYEFNRRPSSNPKMMALLSNRGFVRRLDRLPPGWLDLYIEYCCKGKVRIDPRKTD